VSPRWLPICAAAAFIACALGLLIAPRAVLASYLAVWFSVSAIPIGAIAVLFTAYLVRGGWTHDMAQPLSRAALLTPVAGLLLVPVLIGMGAVYPWAGESAALPSFKAVYLTPLFFVTRSVIYFAIWTALAVWARRAYGDLPRMQRAGSLGLIVWTLTVSVAGIDWLESIEPTFHSSIYGLLTLSFTLLSGFAFALLAVLLPARPRQMANTAYAGVLISLLLLWGYLHAMQYIIIWAGNIPDEVRWYAVRSEGGWGLALWVLFLGQFILPFFALLSARVRGSTRALIALSALTLLLRDLESAVLVLPPLDLPPGWVAMFFVAATVATAAAAALAWRTTAPVLENIALRGAAAGEREPADAAREEHSRDYPKAGERA
jgi:hypothetical protein